MSVPGDGLGPFDVPSASHCCVPRVSFALPVPRNRNLSPSDLSLWAHLLSLPDLGSSQCFVLFHCMFRYSHYSVYQPCLAKMNVVFKAAPGQDIDYIIQSAIIMIRSETAVPRHIYMYLCWAVVGPTVIVLRMPLHSLLSYFPACIGLFVPALLGMPAHLAFKLIL